MRIRLSHTAFRGPSRGATPARGWLASAITLTMVASTLTAPALAQAAPRHGAPPVHDVKPVHATPVPYTAPKPKHMPTWKPRAVHWPSGTAVASLPAHTRSARAGSLPVWVGPAHKHAARTARSYTVRIAPRATARKVGASGVVWSLTRGHGSTAARRVHVRLGYSSFQDAFGGDWASRLRLVTLPGCALSTPTKPACRTQTPVPSVNNVHAQQLSADVPMSSGDTTMVLAATSGASGGGGGDYTATSLHPSGSWQAGGSTDAFTWSYPIPTPDVPGGLEPNVRLTYDSQSQDGLTSSTNNQASWIGDGWDYSPGYIERSYPSCHQNPSGPTRTFDNCWSDDAPITLSLDGANTTLVKDDATGAWHPQNDANEKVEHLTGASNGAHNGEYWRLTTDDGTQYYFGRNQLPGYASGDATTNSTWTEPVYATASGQPCYHATFSDSWCQQAYRWNLDYVVDTHSDAIAYFYSTETGHYARDLGSTADTSYTRGGYLSKITYGQRDGKVYSASPAAQVLFRVHGRCNTSSSGCDTSTLSSSTASDWPDVPYDLHCASGASCHVNSPSFWTEYMLTGITAQALVGSTETTVDSWSLSHSFPATGDSTTPSLWLSSITHTGHDTTAGGSSSPITLPKVTFTGVALSNRVKVTDGYPPITRHRLNEIITETGEKITVAYSSAVPASAIPSDASQNTTRAYPDYWTPTGQTSPIEDWFTKYIVTTVTEDDPYGGSANDTIVTRYTPVGKPTWHYDDNPVTPSTRRTWDQWRGYQGMTTSTGTAPDPVTKTTSTYFRGMDGDTLPNSGTRSASVTDSRGDAAISDLNQYAGMTYETRVFNGSNLVTDTITDPWTSAATASHALGGLPTVKAHHVGAAKTRVYTPLASGSTRETETTYTHDSYGRVAKTNDLGDVSTGNDDLCTTTSYADNTSGWILNTPSEVDTVSVDCSTTPTLPDDAVSDVRTFYDGSTTLGAAPTVGDVTMVRQAASYTGSTPSYVTMSTTTVDEYGRPLSVTDADNHATTTTYTPATGANPTSIAVTDPMGLVTTTRYDPLRELATSVTDPAGYVTTKQYDALGRLTGVWLPGRGTSSSANIKYSYTVSHSAPSVVDTSTLDHDLSYRLSETLYDSLLRARETQVQTPDNKRKVTDTLYNTDGWVSETQGPYVDASPVSATLVQAPAGQVASQTGYTYDGAGRTIAEIAYSYGTETWRTTHIYGGNFVTTVPPDGATATTTVTDARGHTSDLITYHSGVPTDYLTDPTSDYDRIHYTWTPAGKLASETDPAGNTWSWSYNLLGQRTGATDPDTGHTTSVYDHAGQLTSTTDARGKQITHTYDADGRKIGEYDTTATQTLSSSNQLAGWTYDSVKKGLPASTTSYSGGDTITTRVLAYNQYEKVAAQRVTLTGEGTSLVPSSGLVFSYGYALNGLRTSQGDPAGGGLPSESIDYGYDTIDQPDKLTGVGNSVTSSYVRAVGYSELGQPLQYTMGTGGTVYATLTYDAQTRALTSIRTSDSSTSGDVDNLTYTYGNATISKGAGLVTRTVDKQDGGNTVDTQCFGYDYADRLARAWTATDDCAATPTGGTSTMVGGPQPYWQSFAYDAAGDRATRTEHDITGVGQDTVTTYHYPAPGSDSDQPHTLTSTTATGPDATKDTGAYTYDAAGDTKTITGGALGDQSLTWNTQGQLATDTTSAGTTSYVYAADGSLFARRDPGTITVFVGDEHLVLDTGTGAVTGCRYYSIGGVTVAVRTSSSTWYELVPDRQGSDRLAIKDNGQAVTRRQFTPFGRPRGLVPGSWPGDRGYVGGIPDTSTGLENLGAREYDPATGRFLDPDPVLETTSPQQLGGYDYAGNDPVTHADPSGAMVAGLDGLGYGSDAAADAGYRRWQKAEHRALENKKDGLKNTTTHHGQHGAAIILGPYIVVAPNKAVLNQEIGKITDKLCKNSTCPMDLMGLYDETVGSNICSVHPDWCNDPALMVHAVLVGTLHGVGYAAMTIAGLMIG